MPASKMNLDFTNVKEGGEFNKKHQPAGDYKGEILKVQDAVKKDDKSKRMWLFTIRVGTGLYPQYCGFGENELWKIRNLATAAGVNVPKKKVALDPNKLVGKVIGVTLEDDEYDGKMRSNVASTFPVSELEGDEVDSDDEDEEEVDDEETEEDEEEEEPAPKAKKSSKKATEEVDDDELEELEIEEI